jgi:thioredoxin 1
MSVVHITSLGQFKDKLYFETPKSYYVVDFTAKWCGPCRRIAPLFSSLAEKYQQIGFLKVDVDEVPDISNK